MNDQRPPTEALREAVLLHELITRSAVRAPDALALTDGTASLNYQALQKQIEQFSAGLAATALQRSERVAIYLEKRFEAVVASFGAPAAGCVFVPVNPLLKPEQVAFILRDCNVRLLVTSSERLATMGRVLADCPDLRHVVVTDTATSATPPALAPHCSRHRWRDFLGAPAHPGHRVIDTDMVAILYTSGSTGRPKGVVLSHRNMVAGAKSVA